MSATEQFGVIFIRSNEEPLCYAAVHAAFKSSKEAGISEVPNTAGVTQRIRGGWSGLVYLLIRNKAELIDCLGFLARHQSEIKNSKSLRVCAFNKLNHPKILATLHAKGVTDVIELNVAAKTLLHKIQYHLKLVNRKGEPSPIDIPSAPLTGTIEASKSRNQSKLGVVTLVKPLKLAFDYWILRSPEHARFANGLWFIEVVGPGPATGVWENEKASAQGPGGSRWTWAPRDENGIFATPGGNWIFEGRKPEFYWRGNCWRFVGALATLSYVERGRTLAYRFYAPTPASLKAAGNSPQSEALLPQIMETVQKSYRFSKNSGDSGPDRSMLDANGGPQQWGGSPAGELEEEEEADFDFGLDFSEHPSEPDLPDFQTGEDAMKPFHIHLLHEGSSLELVDQDETTITLDAPQSEAGISATFSFELAATSMNQGTPVPMTGIIVSKVAHEIEGREILVLLLNPPSLHMLLGAQATAEKRQDDIFRFFKEAKG